MPSGSRLAMWVPIHPLSCHLLRSLSRMLPSPAVTPPWARSHSVSSDRPPTVLSMAMSSADRKPPRRQSTGPIPARCANTHDLEDTKRAQMEITTPRIKNELSICQSVLCLDLVSFPVLSQLKPQAPLLVVPFCQFLQVSALRPYSPRNPKTLISHKELKEGIVKITTSSL